MSGDEDGRSAARVPLARTLRTLPALAWHELRGLVRRASGRDPGVTLLGSPALTEGRLVLLRAAARAVLDAPDWPHAVQTLAAGSPSAREMRRAADTLDEEFDVFVGFWLRAPREVLRQAADGPVEDRADLKTGLEFEARLNRLSDQEVFAEASALVPQLAGLLPEPSGPASPPPRTPNAEQMAAAYQLVEPLLRPYAQRHGPLPSVLLDRAVRHLAVTRR